MSPFLFTYTFFWYPNTVAKILRNRIIFWCISHHFFPVILNWTKLTRAPIAIMIIPSNIWDWKKTWLKLDVLLVTTIGVLRRNITKVRLGRFLTTLFRPSRNLDQRSLRSMFAQFGLFNQQSPQSNTVGNFSIPIVQFIDTFHSQN